MSDLGTYGDPLDFFRAIGKEKGLPKIPQKNVYWSSPSKVKSGEDMTMTEWSYTSLKTGREHILVAALTYVRLSAGNLYCDHKELPLSLNKYLRNKSRLGGKKFRDFNLMRDSIFSFDEHQPNIALGMYYSEAPRKVTSSNSESTQLSWIVHNHSQGYVLYDLGLNGKRRKRQFLDIDSANHDFRPAIHRTLELFLEIPPRKWHNPLHYKMQEPHVPLPATCESVHEDLLEHTVQTLFSGAECEALQSSLKQARLSMSGVWTSIPRLNLGAIKMPTPGQRAVPDDSFVTTGAAYLIETLPRLGIMDAPTAEQMVTQKLTHYFVHRAGFQLNASRARNILESLTSGNVMEAAAL